MINPFKAVGSTIGTLWGEAAASDCAPGQAKLGVALITPVVAPVVFIAAFFMKTPVRCGDPSGFTPCSESETSRELGEKAENLKG